MKRRLLLLLVLSLIASSFLIGCGSNGDDSAEGNTDVENEENVENEDDTEDTEPEDNTFKVGMEAGYAPFNWTQLDDSNGGVAIEGNPEFAGGYDVEIAKRIADSLGKELVIVKTQWNGLVPSLESGKIDAIIAGMSPTAERMEAIDFSDIYYKSDLVMVVKKGGEYEDATSINDFSGAKVTAQNTTFHYTVIDQIDGVKKETAMADFPAMRVALESGIIDGYVSERPEGVSAEAANENFTFVEFEDGFETSVEDTAIAVGLVKDSSLKDDINEALSQISEEERQEIMEEAIKNQPAAQ